MRTPVAPQLVTVGHNGGVSDVSEPGRPRLRNRWGEGEQLRAEILAGASELLSELGGEDGVTIRGVARAVGVAPASIYEHFKDKAALIAGIREHLAQQLRTAIADADASVPPDDPIGRVRAQIAAYCEYGYAHPGHYRLIIDTRVHYCADTPIHPVRDIIDDLILGFQRCADAGHSLRLSSSQSAAHAFVTAHGMVALFLSTAVRGDAQGGKVITEKLPAFLDQIFFLLLNE
jgi:AcrR family transcriptional regulator